MGVIVYCMLRAYTLFVTFVLFCLPGHADALMPPDIIFNVGYQFVHFFSFITLVIGGLISSLVILLRPHFIFIQKHIYIIIGALVLVTFTSIGIVYLIQVLDKNNQYLEQIENLTNQLQDDARVVTSGPISVATSTDDGWVDVTDARKIFLGDTLYLYGDDEGTPFYLEIDLNRRQAPSGMFRHYYYVIGVHGDAEISDYELIHSTSSVPILTKSIKQFEKMPFADLSTRVDYRGTVLFEGKPLSFTVSGLQGDFITRDSAVYTRYQSVGTGTVMFNNKIIPVRVLSEGVHSSDFSKQIFFEGSDKIETVTRQFILWDSGGNFYMIDQSQVTSNTPEYPSHTWLLYKNTTDGYAKKGFTSNIIAEPPLSQMENSWTITAPEFKNASIRLSLIKYINDGDYQTRLRPLVEGIINDDDGSRSISGFGFIIK